MELSSTPMLAKTTPISRKQSLNPRLGSTKCLDTAYTTAPDVVSNRSADCNPHENLLHLSLILKTLKFF
jgi:hypothetical protein